MLSSACYLPVGPASLFQKATFFPLDSFSSFVKDQVAIGVWVHFWVFNCIPWIYLSVPIQIPCSLFSLVLCNTAGGSGCWFPGSSFIVENCFHNPVFVFVFVFVLLFQMNLRIAISNSLKNWDDILMWIALNLYIVLARWPILLY